MTKAEVTTSSKAETIRGIARWTGQMIAALLIFAALLFLAGPLSVVGFVAWGLILFVTTALLAVHFKKVQPTSEEYHE